MSVKVFKQASTSISTILEEIPNYLRQDVERYPIYEVVCGPLEVTFVCGGKWNVPQYPLAFKAFQLIKALDRKGEYQ